MKTEARKTSNYMSIIMIVLAIVAIVSFYITKHVSPLSTFTGAYHYAFETIVYVLKIVLCFVLFMLFFKDLPKVSIKNTKKMGFSISVILICVSVLIVFCTLYYLLLYSQNNISFSIENIELKEIVMMIIFFIIMPSVFDEIIFRFLLAQKLDVFGIIGMFLFSSLLYALSKFSIYEFPYYFVCGLMFCFVFHFTKSIVLTIVSHLICNIIMFFIRFFNILNSVNLVYILGAMMFICVITFVISFLYFLKKNKKNIVKEHVLSYVFFSPYMFASIVIDIGAAVLISKG